ncbi:uncharacterized protein DUF4365 [Kutzneria buriramensis]|uniref:Uncharacterized protein DUF4365 n=1 Tax=Kutzneria buriramensis TaxID=1045776 RepID=A0A3E0HCP4_9PSEU|nr:uncharacterized protein DUF4365 [Kutzneria buriramensis]
MRAIWADQGAAVEEVRRDYGEDLLVQTRLNGRMDSSRIWVQVKGSASVRLNSSGPLSVPVSSSLLLRWERTVDLVVVVLWDVVNRVGWYATPQEKFSQRDLLANLNGDMKLEISRDKPFDLAAAEHLAWEARIKLANIELQCALQSWQDSEGLNHGDAEYFKEKANATLQNFLFDIGIRSSSGTIAESFMSELKAEAHRMPDGDVRRDVQAFAQELTLLAVMRTIHENSAGNGVPTTLLACSVESIYDGVFQGLSDD